MIAFLTLLYCGVLYLLVKLGVIRLTPFWKISPALWMALLLVVLFIPMQWGAPTGPLTVYRPVVEIVPNVAGEVLEVPVEPLAPLEKGDVLFRIDPRPYAYEVASLEAQLEEARAQLVLANAEYDRNVTAGATGAVSQSDVDVWSARRRIAEAQIDSLENRVERARYDLDQTTVRAPGPGYVIGVTLRPGQRVSSMPARSWMAFVHETGTVIGMGVRQYVLRHVEVGDPAEIVFNVAPGRTFPARVVYAGGPAPQGQLQPSGLVPAAPTGAEPADPWWVILELDGDTDALAAIPTGAAGTGAVYSRSASFTHVIRKIILRMTTWLNFVLPA